jgi:hypothetical protein
MEKEDEIVEIDYLDTFENPETIEESHQRRKVIPKSSIKAVCSPSANRVIAHIDLDCFYVQVERSINRFLKDKPVAVVQCTII